MSWFEPHPAFRYLCAAVVAAGVHLVALGAGGPIVPDVETVSGVEAAAGDSPHGAPWVEEIASNWRSREGDDPDRAAPSFDDSGWSERDLAEPLPEPGALAAGTVWLRRQVRIPPGVEASRLAIAVEPPPFVAYQLFVDGVPAGAAGGARRRLSPPVERLHALPFPRPAPAAGALQLALRVWPAPGAARVGGSGFGGVWIGDRQLLEATTLVEHRDRLLRSSGQLALSCLFLVVGFYHLLIWTQNREEREPLWLALLSMTFGLHAILDSPWIWELTVQTGLVIRVTGATLHLVVFLLYLHLWTFFRHPPGRLLVAYRSSHLALAAAALLVPDPTWLLTSHPWRWLWILVGLPPILVLVVRQRRRGHPEAVPVGLGAFGLVLVGLPVALGELLGWSRLPRASWGFALFVLFLSLSAARRLGHARWQLNRLNRDLEAKVSESTAALVAAEMRYRTLVELNPVPVFLTAAGGEVTDCNRAFLEAFGFERREEALGIPGERLFADPADRQRLLERQRAGVPASGLEVELQRRDGSRFWGLFSEAPAGEGDGVELEATVVDVSARRRERRRLEDSERRYRQLVENSPGLICAHDLQGRILSVNPAACRLLGWAAEDVVGRALPDFVESGVADQVDAYLQEVEGAGESSGLLRVRTRAGEARLILFRATLADEPRGGAEGGGGFVLGFGQDVTELKEAEQELRTNFDAMRDLNRIAATPGLSFRERVNALLDLGRQRFSLAEGIFYQTRGGRGEVMAARPADGGQVPGDALPLDGELHRSLDGGTVARERVGRRGALLGAPVLVGGRPAGQLAFFDDRPRSQAFDAAELEFLKLMALWVGAQMEQEQRAADAGRLAEMSELLQSCASLDEAHRVVVRLAAQFFPDYGGALLLSRRGGQGQLIRVDRWGDDGRGPEEGDVATYRTADCWAARRGREHVVEDAATGLVCGHVERPPPSYLCVPMLAMGELVGVLHLWPLDAEARPGRADRRLAASVAEHAALALINLELREDLRRQSIHDSLTGLHNRRFFDRRLDEEWRRAHRSGEPLSLLLLDIDGFKGFNDTYGHQAGDVCLRRVAEALQGRIRRSGDVVARYGGEEFAAVLPGTEAAQATYLAEAVRTDIEELGVRDPVSPFGVVTISIGVATGRAGEDDDASSLISAADRALYEAKAAGRNRVVSVPGD